MNPSQISQGALAMVLAAVGMWLLLPRGNAPGRGLGALLGIGSLVLFGALGMRMENAGVELVYGVLAVVTVVSAAAAVTFRSPVYCAIWFGLSLLATAGLFMVQGAQFLGVATVVVYAGAILVTFLFVLMLAQPEGHAFYDRVSWEGLLSATAGAVLVGVLTMTVTQVFNPFVDPDVVASIETFKINDDQASLSLHRADIRRARLSQDAGAVWLLELDLKPEAPELTRAAEDRLAAHLLSNLPQLANRVERDDFELIVSRHPAAIAPRSEDRAANILSDDHVARLGGELFSRHLIAIEVAGTLLLVALVGAIAIVAHDRPLRKTGGGPTPVGIGVGGQHAPRNAEGSTAHG